METDKEKIPDIINDLGMDDVQPPPSEEDSEPTTPTQEVTPEVEEKAPPADEEATTTPEEAAKTPIDPARLAAIEQSLTEERTARAREREGMLREIVKLRRQKQQDAEKEEAAAPPPRIPVEFDENGQPFVSPANLAAHLQAISGQASDPVSRFVQTHKQMAQSVLLEDPVNRSHAHNRFQTAYQVLDNAVRYAQAELGAETPDIDSMMELIERTGIDKEFMKTYPDIARDSRDIEDFLQAAVSLNPRRYRRVLDYINSNKKGDTQEETNKESTVETKERVGAMERMSTKPIPMRKLGSTQSPKTKTVLEALADKSPFDWTSEDSKTFLKEMSSLDEQESAS